MDAPERRGLWFGLGAYGAWGLLPLYWKLVDPGPVTTTALRVVVGLATLVVVRRSLAMPLAARSWAVVRRHALAAALIGGNWSVYVYGITTDQVLETSLGYFLNPLLSVLIGVVVLGERLRPRAWVAVALAAVGVAYLTWSAGRLPWVALALAGTFALYGLLRKTSPLESFDGLVVELGLLAPVATGFLATLAWRGDLDAGDTTSTIALAFVGIVTVVPLLLFAAAARRLPLWTVGFLQYVAPTLQFFLGAVVFDEPLDGRRLLGFAVIWAGLAVFTADTLSGSRRTRVRPSGPAGPLPPSGPAAAAGRTTAP